MNLLWAMFFLLCLPTLPGTQAKRQSLDDKPQQPSPPPAGSKKTKNKSVPGSGELTTKEGHSCTWETSGEGLVALLVSCSSKEDQTYWCRYSGQPDLCQAYGTKSNQYWKQLVGKLKKRRNACDGEKVLKTRICKKAPMESHMKLTERSGDAGGRKEEEEEEEEKKKGKGGGKKKDPAPLVAEMMEKKEKEEEKKRTRSAEERDGEVNDMEPVETYCAEGWHSVCSFFVKFFEG